MMVPKQSYEEMSEFKPPKVNSFSNIQIDPNSTQSNQLLPKPQEDVKSLSKDESKKGSAKSVLHEICTSKRWKPPVYDCSNIDGPCHLRFFTYKVVVEIRDSSGTTVLVIPKARRKLPLSTQRKERSGFFTMHARPHQTKLHQ